MLIPPSAPLSARHPVTPTPCPPPFPLPLVRFPELGSQLFLTHPSLSMSFSDCLLLYVQSPGGSEDSEPHRIQKKVFFSVLEGLLGGSAVGDLPSTQVMIPGSGIKSHIRLPTWSLLLPLPVFLLLSLCLS